MTLQIWLKPWLRCSNEILEENDKATPTDSFILDKSIEDNFLVWDKILSFLFEPFIYTKRPSNHHNSCSLVVCVLAVRVHTAFPQKLSLLRPRDLDINAY